MAATESENSILAITTAVFTAVLKIALLCLVGMRLEITGMLNAEKRKCLSALAMDVCLPCLLFSDVLPEADPKLLVEGWQLLLWPFMYSAVGAILGMVCCLAVGTPTQHLGAAAACAAFPNVNGFPVSIIAALGAALPKSPSGFSPMVFLAIMQLTDGMVKYTVGPAVFRRDLRAVQSARARRGEHHEGDFPLGASLRSFGPTTPDAIDTQSRNMRATTSEFIVNGTVMADPNNAASAAPPKVVERLPHLGSVTEFGMEPEQYRCVEPDWSRFDAGKLVKAIGKLPTGRDRACTRDLSQPFLPVDGAGDKATSLKDVARILAYAAGGAQDLLQQLFPPQVIAVILALSIGIAPAFLKELFYIAPVQAQEKREPILGFVYGVAKQLGGGFVPLQMISLGGRLVNVIGDKGPLAEKGAAGPRGRSRLLRIAAAVGFARMVLTPAAMYFIAIGADSLFFHRTRPLAFWSPVLLLTAMPTANNMSTMADLVGSGRSISAATTAMQLMASPVVLAGTLTLLIYGAQWNLASDFKP